MRSFAFGSMTLLLVLVACGNQTVTPAPSSSAPEPSQPSPSAPSPSESAVSPVPAAAPPNLSIEPLMRGLDRPLDIAWRPNDPTSMFVVEQPGTIAMVRDGKRGDPPFLDIADIVTAGGERGLLGMAFLPSGEAGRFFVYYTALDGQQVVASYDTMADDPDRADPSTARIWLTMADEFANHNGGSLVFGPDGFLYIGTGDGGGGGDPLDSGRHLDTLLAKVLRIDVSVDQGGDADPRYRIPPDNPFIDTPGARPEIWLTGLRNPWRIRFDRATGDLWIADVGQNAWEEIDVARAGSKGLDFGWNIMEGAHCFRGEECDTSGLTLPVAEYGHDVGCSVSGGAVYRGSTYPALQGWYILSDYCSGRFWAVDAARAPSDETREAIEVAATDYSISAIVEDPSGEVIATDLSTGSLLRIGASGS
ncbi:MAG TPA: PQQ-dependent sugar dehydrogenase [Candidatus Limnocylindrales bacterium]|jgi:glucose/arabinose dehydrogenase|nr:PQQ-dependent sugar dehydrogenase [Candidatus Limnocylindrales bacterium]